jgi:multidrug efflux pump subunit AcrA (membrane-fusion protein)
MAQTKIADPKKPFVINKFLVFLGIIALAIVGFVAKQTVLKPKTTPQYQTSTVTRGSVVSVVTASGNVALANRMQISTQASGIVKTVFVKNGDTVTAGQKIMEISLDPVGLSKNSQAWSSYLGAKNSLNNAQAAMYSTQATMFTNWKKFTDLATTSTYQNPDGSPNTNQRTAADFVVSQDTWLNAEAQYKNQQDAVIQAQSSVNNAWQSYQLTSPVITAPIAGTVGDITYIPGMVVASLSNQSTNSTTQIIASVVTNAKPVVSVSLAEIDSVKVKEGARATVTLDAFPNQTFTGKLLGINRTGVVSSGVTTYPATIQLDTAPDTMSPNMGANASIIIDSKVDALLVPTAALQTSNGQTTVRKLVNNQIQSVLVETGISDDTNTEVTSGLSENDTVVTGTTTTNSATSTGTSPFSAFGRGGFGGGGAVRIGGR